MLTRWLVVISLVAACSKKQEPPPDPHGACAKALGVFDKVQAGFGALIAAAPQEPVERYCGKLELATRSAKVLVAGPGVRKYLHAGIDKLEAVVGQCTQQGVAATQAAVKEQLSKTRAGVQKTCSK